MTTQPSDMKPSDAILAKALEYATRNYAGAMPIRREQLSPVTLAMFAYLDEQHAAGQGGPYSDLRLPAEGSWVRFVATAARAGQVFQVKENIYNGKPWVTLVGERSIGLVDPALLEPCAAPVAAPPAQPGPHTAPECSGCGRTNGTHRFGCPAQPVAAEPAVPVAGEPDSDWEILRSVVNRDRGHRGSHVASLAVVQAKFAAALAQVEQIKSELEDAEGRAEAGKRQCSRVAHEALTKHGELTAANALLEQERAHSTALRAEVEQLTGAARVGKSVLGRELDRAVREIAELERNKQECAAIAAVNQSTHEQALTAANERAARLEAERDALMLQVQEHETAEWLDTEDGKLFTGRSDQQPPPVATGERPIVAPYRVTPKGSKWTSPEPPGERVTFVINGEDMIVDVHSPDTVTLTEIVEFALRESRNTGRPFADWEVRTVQGQLVRDLRVTVAGSDLPQPLFLTLPIGVGA